MTTFATPSPRASRPRLVHLVPWDLTVGGAQRMIDLWCALEAERWDAHIITPGARGPFSFHGATVHSQLERSQILNLIETLEPDLLVHHEPNDQTAINSKCPQVWILHCVTSLKQQPPDDVKPVMVFSNFDSDEIHPAWRQLSLKISRPQIDTQTFYPSKQKHAGLICGIVGRLHEDKVPPSFIEALLPWHPDRWQIRFVGNGLDTSYQQSVKRKLAKLSWVEFVGDVMPGEVPSALRQLDAVMIPTDAAHGETGSYAALEAMATGLPVIARDLPGLRYNCGNVPLYAASDSDLLARLHELDDGDVRAEIGSRARKSMVEYDVRIHTATHSAGFAAALRCEVSILMPVFDTSAKYLLECWDSIRSQTFRAWELVLVDDGSRAVETIAEIDRIATDPRVTLIRLNENHGIARALNIGMSRCRANLVARMDADDKMMSTRLQRQHDYMRSHPEVTVLGAQLQAIDWETHRLLSPTAHPEQVTDEYITQQHETLEIWFLNHPTVMLRRREVMNLGGYPQYRVAQDLGLWLKVFGAGLKIHNLPTVELHYRLHPDQISTASAVRRAEYLRIIEECWPPSATAAGSRR
jgi:glycosyltransferase involved in cell wall biosynthesis